jgi:uncharacterized protein YggT (Ycf19 family)
MSSVNPDLFGPPLEFSAAVRLVRLIWFVLVVAESIVGLRVLFRALASREEGFVRFVYAISSPLVRPFRPIVTDASLGQEGRRVLEVSSIIAMLLIFLVAYLLVTLIGIVVG